MSLSNTRCGSELERRIGPRNDRLFSLNNIWGVGEGWFAFGSKIGNRDILPSRNIKRNVQLRTFCGQFNLSLPVPKLSVTFSTGLIRFWNCGLSLRKFSLIVLSAKGGLTGGVEGTGEGRGRVTGRGGREGTTGS